MNTDGMKIEGVNAARPFAVRPLSAHLVLAAGWLLALGDMTVAAEEPAGSKPVKGKPAASALDDELFKDLSDGPPAAEPKTPTSKKEDPALKPAEPDRSATAKPSAEGKPEAATTIPAKKPLNPLDEELLKDLGGDEAKPSKKPKDDAHGSSGEAPRGGKPASGGDAEEGESDDPIVRLSRRVRDAERRLKQTDSGDRTQELQRGIVEDLEKLIAQIEKQKSQQSSSKSKGPPSGSKPGQKKPGPQKPGGKPGDTPSSNPTDSSDQLTAKKSERPEAGKLKEMLEKVWGRLPERERQDVMQSSFEDFPTKYQDSIEQYFKALLQRKD